MLAIDSLVGKWQNFDRGMEFVVGNDLIQGTVAASIFWWYWARTGTEATVRRACNRVLLHFRARRRPVVPLLSVGRGIPADVSGISLPHRYHRQLARGRVGFEPLHAAGYLNTASYTMHNSRPSESAGGWVCS